VAEIGDRGDCRSIFVTPEGRYPQRLYFGTNFDPEKKDFIGDNFDLYFLIKQDRRAEFTTLTPLHFSTARDELHPWLTPDGKHIYFSRKDPDGWHVYLSAQPPGGGQWGKPVRVDLPVNFYHPTLSPDGTEMYLQGPLEKERVGLYRSIHAPTGWSKPEPLTTLNSPEAPKGDRSPCLSRDGSRLYFASDRPGGKGGWDLWVIPTYVLKKK
jgi:Tol biopolymer transport system component